MSSPTFTFKQRPLTPSERLWLTELARSPGLSAKFAKVKLYGQLPPDFSPDHIDPRLYVAGRPTPMGLWHVDPSNWLFHAKKDARSNALEVFQRRVRGTISITLRRDKTGPISPVSAKFRCPGCG